MDSFQAIGALSALAHEGRLAVFQLLVRRAPEAVPAGRIAEALGLQATTLSNHLSRLEKEGLVRWERSGRRILYAADLEGAGRLLGFLANDCCKGRPEACLPVVGAAVSSTSGREEVTMPTDGVFNVLFLCTHNSARSIMGEAILTRLAPGRFRGFSAGSAPRDAIHPQTLSLLRGLNYDISSFRPKDWSEFAAPGAPEMHFVFTVCDQAANEVCPVWPGQPMTAHWGVEDPSAAQGSDSEIAFAFAEAYRHLFNRLTAFTALPLASLDRLALQKSLDDIGRMPAPAAAPTS